MKPITLKNPIKRGDKEITEVTIREPKGGELRGTSLAEFSELQTDVVIKLIPRVSNPSLTEQEAETLCALDLLGIGAAMIGANKEKAGNGTTQKA